MDTLLLRLQAPMQSWGIASQFSFRDSAREPSKSGILGLICAALGRSREEPVNDLASLKMGIRADREGSLLKDYHIAREIFKADGGIKPAELSNRYYLSDAVFLVGLEGDSILLGLVQEALHHPKWELYLGRKAFPPAMPVWLPDGLQANKELLSALSTYPLLISTSEQHLRVAIEDPTGNIIRRDVPVSFENRQFSTRIIQMITIPTPEKKRLEDDDVSF